VNGRSIAAVDDEFTLLSVAVSDNRPEETYMNSTVRGAIGGDFDAELPLGAVNGADWGVDISLPKPAGNPLSDGSIHVNVSHGRSGAVGQVRPTTSVPGSGASRFGFKPIWDSPNNGDSFIDAVWAYHYP
jgi:hypothetical protein